MTGAASSIPVYAKQVEPIGQELCASGLTCWISGLVTDLWLVVLTSTVAAVVLLALGYLQSARSITTEEQSRTATEREAFLRFARRINRLEVPSQTTPQAIAEVGFSTSSAGATQRESLDDVRQSYIETVMAIPHYDEDYGESMVENMAIEFGEDIAQVVANGTHLSPQLQQLLVTKAKQAARDRERMMNSLEREAASLQEAEDTFSSIQDKLEDYSEESLRLTPYHRFTNLWGRLETFDEDCREVLRDRQEHLKEEPLDDWTPGNVPSLVDYLYEPLDVDYPVLAAGTEVVGGIQQARQYLTSTVARRA